MNNELQKKVDMAIKLIQSAEKAAKAEGETVEVCYSGGKDSDIILELAKMSGIDFRAIYKNTTIDPPQTIKHVKGQGCVEIMRPEKNFFEIIEKNGYPSRFQRKCCSYLKEYKVLNHAIVGIRRCESANRAKMYKEPIVCRYTSRKRAHINQYLPILEWTDDDVVEFIRDRNIQCHPLYYQEGGVFSVKKRLGCLCCPMMSKKQRIAEFKKYPNLVKAYIRSGQKYRDTHPNVKNIQTFSNVYDWFTMQLFCDTMKEFEQKFGKDLFGNKINCKQYLEEYFNIKFSEDGKEDEKEGKDKVQADCETC